MCNQMERSKEDRPNTTSREGIGHDEGQDICSRRWGIGWIVEGGLDMLCPVLWQSNRNRVSSSQHNDNDLGYSRHHVFTIVTIISLHHNRHCHLDRYNRYIIGRFGPIGANAPVWTSWEQHAQNGMLTPAELIGAIWPWWV